MSVAPVGLWSEAGASAAGAGGKNGGATGDSSSSVIIIVISVGEAQPLRPVAQ